MGITLSADGTAQALASIKRFAREHLDEVLSGRRP
jgi:hypothetical protein